jgi:hypothetical protein
VNKNKSWGDQTHQNPLDMSHNHHSILKAPFRAKSGQKEDKERPNTPQFIV